jgi:hypothetical protein
MDLAPFMKNLPPLIGLGVLVLVLLFVLVNYGYLRACDIPGFSGVYYSIKGKPNVAIVYGDDGIGDAKAMQGIIAQEIHKLPLLIPSKTLYDSAALADYQIVIVEHAKTMTTQTLAAFQRYVSSGGKLIWIGDAGTGLGPNDYICEQVTFTYCPAVDSKTGTDAADVQEVQGQWVVKNPDDPASLKSGLCAKSFGEIVMKFIAQNESTYASATTAPVHLCRTEMNPYVVSGADRITNCIAKLKSSQKEVTADNANQYCDTYNYWKRGPSKSATGDTVAALDFSQQVLGIDFVKDYGASNLFFTPVGSIHQLVRGYESGAPVDFSTYFGVSNVTFVDSSRFSLVPRTSTVLSMRIDTNDYPAIIVSSPYLQINRNGLIVYYAFAPDDIIKAGQGLRLIDNLFSFMTC